MLLYFYDDRVRSLSGNPSFAALSAAPSAAPRRRCQPRREGAMAQSRHPLAGLPLDRPEVFLGSVPSWFTEGQIVSEMEAYGIRPMKVRIKRRDGGKETHKLPCNSHNFEFALIPHSSSLDLHKCYHCLDPPTPR